MEGGLEFPRRNLLHGIRLRRNDRPAFMHTPAGSGGFGLERQMVGYLVEPAGNGFVPLPRGRLGSEDDEHRLADVFGVMPVVQQAPANPQDHRAVPPDQRRKRSLVVLVGEALQQLAIRGLARGACAYQPPEVLHDRAGAYLVHGCPLRRDYRFSYPGNPFGARIGRLFLEE
jgi:hypothetical protein